MRYKRITLVAKAGGERMTIDTDVLIVEAKSALVRGYADNSLRLAG